LRTGQAITDQGCDRALAASQPAANGVAPFLTAHTGGRSQMVIHLVQWRPKEPPAGVIPLKFSVKNGCEVLFVVF
jgi:hypothetical protein